MRFPGRRRRAWSVALVILVTFVAAMGCLEFAAGDLPGALVALGGAGLGVIAALLLRLNWRLIELNDALLEQNADLNRQVDAMLTAAGLPGRRHGTEGGQW